ncbi:MAG: hypothetical protein ITG01_06320 [Comamonas sp.]|nr:hypothetical protein [Comamonas sp.]
MSVISKTKIAKEVWVLAGVAVLGAACIWPLQRLQTLPAKHTALDQQLMQVQAMAAQAQQLRALQSAPLGNGVELLQMAVSSTLGTAATVTFAGDAATLVLNQVEPANLARGLEVMRQNTAARFTSAKLDIRAEQISGRLELQLPAGQP